MIDLTHTDISRCLWRLWRAFGRGIRYGHAIQIWRMWRAILIHLTHKDIGSIIVEGFLIRHQILTRDTELWKTIVPYRMFLNP